MNGYIAGEFFLLFDGNDRMDFNIGDEVEVLKVLEDNTFASGVGFVVLNKRTQDSITVDSTWVKLQN